MLRPFLLFLLLVVSLSASSDNDILNRANGFLNSSNKSNHFRAYNDYKNLYLRSIMLDDSHLRVKSLKGIVKSGKKLHIDVSQYSNELAGLNTSKAKPVYKPYIPKRKKEIKVTSSHKLKNAGFKNSELVLEFDQKLSKKQVNYFTLYDPKKKQFKYIFDIHASMLNKSKTLRKEGVKRIKLAQYNPNTLRLVIENTKKINVRYSQTSQKLIIKIDFNCLEICITTTFSLYFLYPTAPGSFPP